MMLYSILLFFFAGVQGNTILGTCNVYNQSLPNATICATLISNWTDHYFLFFGGSETAYLQGLAQIDSYIAQGLFTLSQQCTALLFSFACRNLFAPCLDIYTQNNTYQILTRVPVCKSVCESFFTTCQSLLRIAPLAVSAVPDLAPFLNCSYQNASVLDGLPLYPDTNYTFPDGTVLYCDGYLPNITPTPTPTPEAPAPSPVSPSNSESQTTPNIGNLIQGNSIVLFLVLLTAMQFFREHDDIIFIE